MAFQTRSHPDISEIKMHYYEILHEAAINKPVQVLKRRQWVNVMIQRILSAKETRPPSASVGTSRERQTSEVRHWERKLPPAVKEALYNYDVMKINSEQRLILKPKKPKDTAKVIVPLEESFEIVMKAHFETRHGGCSEMNKYISDMNHAVAMICAPVLISACQKCLLNEEGEEEVGVPIEDCYSTLALVNIVDMSLQPDKSFNHLLLYQDLKTKFVQLRPLTTKDLTEEISMELLKMFSDFSPPVCIVAIEELKEVFENVLARLNAIINPPVLLETCDGNDYRVTCEVINRLRGWIQNGTNEWSIGCHFVQWEINRSRNYNGSRYEKFFGLDRADNSIPYKVGTREDDELRRKNDNLTDGDDNLSVSDDINLETEYINDSPQRTSEENISDTLEVPSIVIRNVKTEQRLQSETKDELDTDIETQMHICCMCCDTVTAQVYFCSECKKCLHFYCGVRRKAANDVIENVCFVCIKP